MPGVKRVFAPYPLSGIYKITCLASGKIYVGHSVDFENRWLRHTSELNTGKHPSKHMLNAWRKYGAASFIFEILEVVDRTKGELVEAEQRYLDALRPYDPAVGYNTNPTSSSRLGSKLSIEQRKRIGDRQRGRKITPEHKAKISEANLGKKLTKGHALKISRSQSFFNEHNINDLLRLRTAGWSSIKLASHFGCNKSVVLRTLKGRQTAHWAVSDPLPETKWVTGQFPPRLTGDQAIQARHMAFEGVRNVRIAEHFNVRRHIIEQILNGKSYKYTKLDFMHDAYY